MATRFSTRQPTYTTPRQRRRRTLLWAIPLLLALATAAVAFFLLSRKPAPTHVSPEAALTVTVQPAAVRSLPRQLNVTGSISAWDLLTVGAEAAGLRIESVLVDVGDTVRRGQPLAYLNADILRAQLREQQAQLAGAQAALARARQPLRTEEIAELAAAVQQAEASLEQEQALVAQAQVNLAEASRNAERYRGLAAEGAISAEEAERRVAEASRLQAGLAAAQRRVAASRQGVEQARQRLQAAQAGGRREDILSAQATVEQNRANVQRIREQIEQTVVRAPSAGTISERTARIGDISTTGEAMFTIIRDNRIEFLAQIPETDIALIRPGQTVQIRSQSGAQATGRVRELLPTVNAQTRLGTVRIDMPNSNSFRPGMFAQGTIVAGSTKALTVPGAALQGNPGEYFVFVYDEGIARRRQVTTTGSAGAYIVVTAGLRPGELVITEGAGFLTDGDRVAVAPGRAAG